MIFPIFCHLEMPKGSKAQRERNKKGAEAWKRKAAEKRRSLESPDRVDNVTRRKRKSVGLNTGFRESGFKVSKFKNTSKSWHVQTEKINL